MFDIGANKGHYALEALKINNTTKIYAFEPHPKIFNELRKNVSATSISVKNKAVSDVQGNVLLYDYFDSAHSSSHATLCAHVIEDVHKSPSTSYEVGAIILDDFIHENQIHKINLLKIDTEGHELKVLRGGMKSIDANMVDVIQFEFTQINSTSRIYMKDFYDLLSPKYSFFRLLPNGFLPLGTYSPTKHEIFGYQNIIAVRREFDVFRRCHIKF
ncbi:MAG: FkbM family methyltransferase [Candidatus Omnitrophota bacterium]